MPQATARTDATRAVVFSPLDAAGRAELVEQRLADAIVAGVLNHFARWYEAWTARGNLRAEYVERCASIGADLAVRLDGEPPVHGIGRGVDQYGRLEVANPDGVRAFAVGDVVHARLGS